MHVVKSYLVDSWIAGQEPTTPLFDAYTGKVMAITSSKGLDLRAALAHARDVGGPALRAMTFTQRGELIKKLSEVVHASRDELCELAGKNSGNTRSDAKFDVDGGSGTLAYYASLGKKLGDKTHVLDGAADPILRSARFVGQHVYLPRHGVAIHINAFNFPAWGLCEKLAAAFLAGMPVLVKPATATCLVTARIVEKWVEAGILPAGTLQLLCGSAGDLLDHVGPQDVVSFTGSGETGRMIRGHAAVLRWNVRVGVEADSLNAAVLGPDVEVGSETFQMFVNETSKDITQKAGQKCTAIRRIVVPTALADEAIAALADRLSQAVLGNPDERATTVSPLATESQQADAWRRIEDLALVATRVAGDPDEVPETGFFVGPSLFRVEGGAAAPFVHDHEIFGPVATVIPYDGSAAEAVAIVARGRGSLVTSVYTDDTTWAKDVLFGIAPHNGRVQWGSKKVHDQGAGPGTVLPQFVHGGPGAAGGGEELGGERGLAFYWQRTAIQGDRALLERIGLV